MSTARDYIKGDMDKRPEQLQREADEVRADLEHTMDDLANQFSPGELFNQAVTLIRGNGDSNFVQNLSNQIQNNPIPAILAGVGLTWLMSASNRPPASGGARSSFGESTQGSSSPSGKVSSAMGAARSSANNLSQGAKEKKQHLADNAGDMKQRANELGRQTADSTRSGGHAVRNTYNDLIREQPLMVGALAVAAGAALGAMLPRTQAEDDAIGEFSDAQKEGVKHQAESVRQQAADKAEETLQEQHSASGSSNLQADPSGAVPGSSSGTGEDLRRDAATPTTHSRGAPTTNPPIAGASGSPDSSRSADTSEDGIPVATPSAVPEHPDANPPELNRRDDDRR